MEDKPYKLMRRIFFWLFFFAFIISLPLVIFYSLGYQFNPNLKRFQKTGIISIKSSPQNAEVYLQGNKIQEVTPCDLKELLPGVYKIKLEKEGFYPYQIDVDVRSSFVSVLDAILIPKIKDVEKVKLETNFYKLFAMEHLFGKRIIAFAQDGIYILNEELEEITKISPLDLTEEQIESIQGIREGRNNLVFWNPSDIWLIDYGAWGIKKELRLEHLYHSANEIREVFFGFKDRYLIIQTGNKIIARDIRNKDIIFEIYYLTDKDAEIYYDNSSDSLFIKDKIPPSDKFCLFKVNITKKIYEKKED